jgi:hypothetical protein
MLLMEEVKNLTTNERLKFIGEIRANPETAAAVASIVLELAEFKKRELTNEKGKPTTPGLLSFKRLKVFRAFFVFQAERANKLIDNFLNK